MLYKTLFFLFVFIAHAHAAKPAKPNCKTAVAVDGYTALHRKGSAVLRTCTENEKSVFVEVTHDNQPLKTVELDKKSWELVKTELLGLIDEVSKEESTSTKPCQFAVKLKQKLKTTTKNPVKHCNGGKTGLKYHQIYEKVRGIYWKRSKTS